MENSEIYIMSDGKLFVPKTDDGRHYRLIDPSEVERFDRSPGGRITIWYRSNIQDL